MWESLGFRESPYNTNPLKPRAEDVELLVGRETEATELCTILESSTNGILVLSGSPGVGKTSFFNVQQYKLENRLSAFGPRLLAARNMGKPGSESTFQVTQRTGLTSWGTRGGTMPFQRPHP